MRLLQSAGLTRFTAPPPPLTELGRQAVECWDWCDGWNPAVWPSFEAFHDVPDWHALIDVLQVLKQARDSSKRSNR